MPKIKRTLTNIEMLTSDDANVIEEFIKINNLQPTISRLQEIFKTHFCLSDKEISIYINNICKSLEERVVRGLEQLYQAFVENDVKDFNHNERCLLARGIVDDTLALYNAQENKISDEFVEILKQAQKLNIDPFKLAIKTNMQFGKIDKFLGSLEALTVEKYHDKNLNTAEVLFSQDEYRQITEQCASIACKANKESVERILELLKDLFYDKETKKYVYDVKSIVREVPSILLANPEKLELNILLLESDLNLSHSQLLTHIKQSPSLLLVDFEKIFKVSESLKEEISSMLSSKKTLTTEQKLPNYAQRVATNFAFDIYHLTQLGKVKTENITRTAKILKKYVGEDNAINCLQNTTVLATNPDFLELFLATLVKEEQSSHENLRKFFVENPYRALTKLDIAQEVQGGTTENPTEEIKRGERKRYTAHELPAVTLTEYEFSLLEKRAGARKVGLTQELLNKIRKLEEERLARQKAEEEERRRQRNEEKKAKKKGRRERQKEQSKKPGDKGPENPDEKPTETPEPAISEEEQLALRQASRLASIPAPEEYHYDKAPLPEMFERVYAPIINAFKSCSFYKYKKLGEFNEFNKAFNQIFTGMCDGLQTHAKILALAADLKTICYDATRKAPSTTILQNLSATTTSGESVISVLQSSIKQICDESDKNMALVNKGFKTLNAALKQQERIGQGENHFTKLLHAEEKYLEYAKGLEAMAQDFFGPQYEEKFFAGARNDARTCFKDIMTKNPLPACYNHLELNVFIKEYIALMVSTFIQKGIMNNPTAAELKAMVRDDPEKFNIVPSLANASENERFLILSSDVDELYGTQAADAVVKVTNIYNDLCDCLQKQNMDINFCVNHDEHEVYIRFKNAVASDKQHTLQSEFSLKSEKDAVFNFSVMGLMPSLLSEDDDQSDGN